MTRSTPIPLVDEQVCCGREVYVAFHTVGGGGEILGVFTNEKAAKKCAMAAKREDGYKGKEAKLHAYTVWTWGVEDKFDG